LTHLRRHTRAAKAAFDDLSIIQHEIEKKWAHSFIAGLVPPSVVETAEKCPNGIAKVETQLSFLKQLASFVTLGIYSPMEIVVSCAGASAAQDAKSIFAAGGTRESRISTMQTAVDMAAVAQEPIYVPF
jgi:hypothetical protein